MEYNNSTEISDNELQLCPGCQTFFGRKETNYMCSKCFKGSQASQPSDSTQKDQVKVSEITEKPSEELLISSTPPVPSKDIEMVPQEEASTEEKKVAEVTAPKPKKNRCNHCNKKTGLLGFSCKCELNFCAKHRHADDHNCSYDYQAETKKILEEKNPVVEASKFGRI
ncbi:unnamed protein product [Moneuplotes crassus]|uniref:AN1-type domain-containing protein n=1 Tax=Euplotes crassus TaxID=5936 RepID=A0A7S3KEY8_EUPCR|nr:unnamed protein product [Moneuplotes crassus]|mmetsp:Transcript_22172/g.21962  ORF Transcript_22172/g.21962 Transcript_22172/m.21962 type:complete len:168 (+) Transcript_22172:22-525(+)|eukprot:CAMPEP_0196994724 /NCGR_PEP_ID=MMETSP1380-20130617/982_1 /TAXON_ID=5936 /ORGANISM="Euplotes crassus, Strain CT5" /LENGTH=167 /DNA_ID=CAMNT_0042410175 /DNA_START=15 /DNA_END=518 /DNA_ORIENTATION=+